MTLVEQPAGPDAREFQQRLRAFVRRRVPGEAEADDVLQEVLTKLVQRGADVPDTSLQAWLWTVTRRVLAERVRSARPAVELPEDLPASTEGEEAGALSELAGCVGPMLQVLDAEDRTLLTRVDLEGVSQVELARELALSPSGLKSRVQRARERLRVVFDRCCLIERDRHGLPLDFRTRPGGTCGPGSGSCGP
jgi:RNA polymerase sigma-70 factor, ECF subfamily